MLSRPSPFALFIIAGLGTAFGCSPFDWEPPPVPGVMRPPPNSPVDTSDELDDDDDDGGPSHEKPATSAGLKAKIAQFAPVTISADLSNLPEGEKKALEKLIAASKLLDEIFDRQVWAGNPALEKKLSGDKQTYFQIMRGPWDRQDEFKPFAIDKPHPPGAGFYPEDLTATELDAYLKKHPEEEKQILGLFTVVQRKGGKLVTVPYGTAYAEWLKPAAELLREAAELTANKTLKKFLRSRADAFLSDDYYQSDVDWMDLDSRVEVTIGPYEVYEDGLKNAKAAYESFVTVADPTASQKLAKYKQLLVAMEQNLPVPDNMKSTKGKKSPIRVVDLVFAAGDARKSVQTIAFNLPNDEKVRAEKGSKKVLLRNVINVKYERLLKPIAERVLAPAHHPHIGADGFFNEVLFHELSHSLGPGKIKVDSKEIDVREALQETYSAIEECKADVMGAYNVLFLIGKKEFPKTFRSEILVTYFGGLFRSVRFGVAEAHGRGAAIQINRHLEAGAATFDPATKTFALDLDKLEKSISDLTRDLVVLQFNGDKKAAQALLDKYGVMSPPMKEALGKVTDLPVDLRPSYPLAGEPAG
jgi:hypothetical protein